jgi:hypothetical protein
VREGEQLTRPQTDIAGEQDHRAVLSSELAKLRSVIERHVVLGDHSASSNFYLATSTVLATLLRMCAPLHPFAAC